MKKLITLLLALLLILSITVCGEKDDTAYYLTESQFVYGEETQRVVYDYNESWQIVETVTYYNGEEENRVTYTYDEFGNERTQTICSGGEVIGQVQQMNTYDEAGNLIRTETIRDGELTVVKEMTYDTEGNRLTLRTENIKSGYEIDQTFRSDGKLLSSRTVSFFPEIGPVDSTVEHTYDNQGRVSETVNYYNSGSSGVKTVTEYRGSDDRPRKETISDAFTGEMQYYNEYTYDGNVETVKQCMADGSLVATTVRTYDDAGNLLKNEFYDRDGDLQQTLSYTYTAGT